MALNNGFLKASEIKFEFCFLSVIWVSTAPILHVDEVVIPLKSSRSWILKILLLISVRIHLFGCNYLNHLQVLRVWPK